jgi:hypothetical protein
MVTSFSHEGFIEERVGVVGRNALGEEREVVF